MIGVIKLHPDSRRDSDSVTLTDGVRYSVASALSSGALSYVYTVGADAPSEAERWVLKFDKEKSSGVSLARHEYDAITNLREKLSSKVRSVLPHVELVLLDDGRDGVLLERMQRKDLLLTYYQHQTKIHSPLRAEQQVWEIAVKYCTFLQALSDAGFTGNDRKLGDFYYIADMNRLVVLDWNVIADIADTRDGEGTLQDVRLFARVWFNLFGGVDEAKFNVRSRQIDHITVAGRNLLYTLMQKSLRETFFKDNRRNIGKTLADTIISLLDKIETPPSSLDAALKRELERNSLNSLPSDGDVESYLMPHWELADLLARKRPDMPVPELAQIKGILEESDHFPSVQQNLEYPQIALEQIELLKNAQKSQRAADLLGLWQRTILEIQSAAPQAGVDPAPYREFSQRIGNVIADFVQPEGFADVQVTQRIRQLQTDLADRIQVDRLENRSVLSERIRERIVILGALLAYSEGAQALIEKDAVLAEAKFDDSVKKLEQLSEQTASVIKRLLPTEPATMVKRLRETIKNTTYFDQLREYLKNCQVQEAFQHAEQLRLHPGLSIRHRQAIDDWLAPVLWLQAMNGMPPMSLPELARSIDQACVFALSEDVQWKALLRQAVAALSKQYLVLTTSRKDRSLSLSDDWQAKVCGERLQNLMKSLEAVN